MLRTGVTVIALSLGAATAASAQPAIDTLLSSLARQGFGAFEVDRENGQLKVEARRGAIERELTYDAATGKLLKDEVGRRDDRDDDRDDDRADARDDDRDDARDDERDDARNDDRNDDRDDHGGRGRGGDGHDRDDDDRADDRGDRGGSGRGGPGRGGDDDGPDDHDD